ncbi:MAG: 50S ribosomal protein L25 [Candidatus Omnitrophica bacterium]|nr:50S ribosomal protein L25 [Candidatus Omnitrophota bacterium]
MAKARTALLQTLTLRRRAATGTRVAGRLRREGLVPGVVYGKDTEPISVTVNGRELLKLLHAKAGERTLVTLRIDGSASWEKPALVHAIQHHVVNGQILHVDFHTILLTERLRVQVPVVLKGEPVGVKQDGGLLEHFLREVEVECLPTEIPGQLEFDVTALKVGDAVHVRDLISPHHAKITNDPDGVIASVKTPKTETVEEEAAAVTEPEVIREKREEAASPAGEETKAERPEAKKDTKS